MHCSAVSYVLPAKFLQPLTSPSFLRNPHAKPCCVFSRLSCWRHCMGFHSLKGGWSEIIQQQQTTDQSINHIQRDDSAIILISGNMIWLSNIISNNHPDYRLSTGNSPATQRIFFGQICTPGTLGIPRQHRPSAQGEVHGLLDPNRAAALALMLDSDIGTLGYHVDITWISHGYPHQQDREFGRNFGRFILEIRQHQQMVLRGSESLLFLRQHIAGNLNHVA